MHLHLNHPWRRGHFCVDCVPVHQYAASQPERKKKKIISASIREGELDREEELGKNSEQGQQEI